MPHALLHNLKHNRVLHERIILLTVKIVDQPYWPEEDRAVRDSMGEGFHRLILRYGFMEEVDVPAALTARTYSETGALTLEVRDRVRPSTGGTFRLAATGAGSSGERPTCERIDGPADLALDVADLGACWLGGASFRRLALAGRAEELADGAAATADRMFRTDPVPWCWVRF